jgi:hypothetical protein
VAGARRQRFDDRRRKRALEVEVAIGEQRSHL